MTLRLSLSPRQWELLRILAASDESFKNFEACIPVEAIKTAPTHLSTMQWRALVMQFDGATLPTADVTMPSPAWTALYDLVHPGIAPNLDDYWDLQCVQNVLANAIIKGRIQAENRAENS